MNLNKKICKKKLIVTTLLLLFTISYLFLSSCSLSLNSISYEDTWLDSSLTEDPSLTDNSYLVSSRIPTPSEEELNKPVIIAVHGYTATTYEWAEFKTYAEATANVLVSLVLLGSHGRNIDDFKNSTWQQWGQPIIEEYKILVAKGYKNINFVASSTGCPLILEKISSGAFAEIQAPNNIFFIDPIIVASNKFLYLVDIIGPILGNLPTGDDRNEKERANWYNNNPYEPLSQLKNLINLVKNELSEGIVLPQNTKLKIYKAKHDDVADPISALLIYKGLTDSSGNKIAVEMVDSNKHVFTQLQARSNYSNEDKNLQIKTFAEIIFYTLSIDQRNRIKSY